MTLYSLITYKRKLEELIMWPFVQAGRRWATDNPLSDEYDVFFFFPIYGLGGAEKVNADILECVSDKRVVIFFTRTSYDTTMLSLFKKSNAVIYDISKYTDNKRRYWNNLFYRGVCAYYINQQKKKPVVFNGQCNFAYKLFPHIRKDILKIELIHNSHKHFAWVTFPYIPYIDQRIMIAECLITAHSGYYDEIGLEPVYKKRIRKIINKIEVPMNAGPKSEYGSLLNVYYAGRGGAQKRVWLIMEAIKQCLGLRLPITFHLAGNFKDEIPASLFSKINFYGEITGGPAMNELHQKMDILMLTSAYEGFPLVIMEAMINGVVPIATAVDGVPEHVKNGYNGLLITTPDDEAAVISQLVNHLNYLCNNRNKLKEMSQHAYSYALENFTGETFCNNYRNCMGF